MYDPSSPMLRPAVTGDGAPAPEAKARFAEDRLLDAVIWCEIAPGEIVTEADMMERFGLTRAAARSGLTRLGYDGWATPQPRTGWLILPVTGSLIGQVLDARRIAEPALATAPLSQDGRAELQEIAKILDVLKGRPEETAIVSFRHYIDRVDGLLLQAVNSFTARHLRKLWHHSARITHFLEDPASGQLFHRTDTDALMQAVLTNDADAIASARAKLIDDQEAFFLRRLLHDETPLAISKVISSGTIKTQKNTTRRREL